MVAPGFYDGFGPPAPYNWTCPPPQAGANTKPGPGHTDFKVIGGVSDAGSAYDRDGQIVIGFLPGAFDATGKTTIAVDVTPLATCPQPAGIQFVTNVYQITGSAPIVKAASLVLRYSNLEPAPSECLLRERPGRPMDRARDRAAGAALHRRHNDQAVRLFRRRVPVSLSASGSRRLWAAAARRCRSSSRSSSSWWCWRAFRSRSCAAANRAAQVEEEGDVRGAPLVVLDRFEQRAALAAAVLERHGLRAEQRDHLRVARATVRTPRI